MELINRDDVIAILNDEIYTEECEFDDGDCVVCWVVDDKDAVIERIKRLTPYERRPKGKWIIEQGCEEVIVICSNCGAKDYVPTTIDGRFYFNRNYCWDCGANMRSEE